MNDYQGLDGRGGVYIGLELTTSVDCLKENSHITLSFFGCLQWKDWGEDVRLHGR